MTPKEIRILKLLEAVETDTPTNQRALASKLDVSLGLVNGFLQKMAGEGLCCISSSAGSQKKYILTPEGIAEKSRLTYDYMLLTYRQFKESLNKLKRFFQEMEALDINRVVFFGVNDLAEMAYLSLQKTSVKMIAVVDRDKIGDHFFGRMIEDPIVLPRYSFDKILITQNKLVAKRLESDLNRDGFKGKVETLVP